MSHELEQLEFKLEKNIGISKHAGKVRKAICDIHSIYLFCFLTMRDNNLGQKSLCHNNLGQNFLYHNNSGRNFLCHNNLGQNLLCQQLSLWVTNFVHYEVGNRN